MVTNLQHHFHNDVAILLSCILDTFRNSQMYFVKENGTHLAHVEGHLPDDADHAPQDGANVGELKIYLDITYLSTAI